MIRETQNDQWVNNKFVNIDAFKIANVYLNFFLNYINKLLKIINFVYHEIMKHKI